MRPNGTIRTWAASYRNEFQQANNTQRKVQFASELASRFVDCSGDACDRKTAMHSVMTAMNRLQRRKPLSSSLVAKKRTFFSNQKRQVDLTLEDHHNVWQQSFQDHRLDVEPVVRSAPLPSAADCEEREQPAYIAASHSCCESDVYGDSREDDTGCGGEELELSLQISPDDDEERFPCSQISFDASATRDDDEISILSSSECVDDFDLAIFQGVCDPFPDEQVDVDLNRSPY